MKLAATEPPDYAEQTDDSTGPYDHNAKATLLRYDDCDYFTAHCYGTTRLPITACRIVWPTDRNRRRIQTVSPGHRWIPPSDPGTPDILENAIKIPAGYRYHSGAAATPTPTPGTPVLYLSISH